MGFFSKLFGGNKEAEKEAKDLLNGLFGGAKPEEKEEPKAEAPAAEPAATNAYADACDNDEIPAEENQYNYKGTYEQYFEHVFAEDFPAYRFEKSYLDDYGKHRVIYTFFKDEAKALVIELMTESSAANKFKNDCIKAGIPYLRFYYDHEGWWNTRTYVVGRMRSVLNG